MISEIVTWCLTSCPAYVRRMGYLYEGIALRERYLRRSKSWQPHLENTKRFLLKTAAECKSHDKVIVLGSGLLFDVPIDELASMFREVVLVDVVHLSEVKRRVKRYGNVKLVQADITGVAGRLYSNIKNGLHELPESMPLVPALDEKTGLVVSLNIVSQLATTPVDYLLKRGLAREAHELDAWCDRIRSAHVDLMRSLRCAVCLIADHEFIYRDGDGNTVEQGSTVGRLTFPHPQQAWTWHIAPYGEERPDRSKELNVGAWAMNKGNDR